jgi:hypothetical protein
MARDNFKTKVKEQLAKRVNYLCSNPECRSLTLGPKQSADGPHSIGIAAHIRAASPLGPRYDNTMSAAKRADIENGIWLCSNCSTKIDKDELRYPPETLMEWKESTESFVLKQQGKKFISAQDVSNTLSTALSGYPKKLIPDAIKHIHDASSETLEALDKRFQVQTSYINNTPVYEIRAKETTNIRISVKGKDASEFVAQYKSLLETGSQLEIPSNNLFFEGSKLFEEMLSGQEGVFRISPHRREAVVKLQAAHPLNSETIVFDEIKGHVSVGSRQFSFTGESCKGIVKLNIKHQFNDESTTSICNISLDLDSWQGMEVSKIPFFSNVFEFAENIFLGAQLSLALEVEGNRVTAEKTVIDNGREMMGQTYCLLKYTRATRAVSTKFNMPFKFDYKSPFSKDEFMELLAAERIINNQAVLTQEDITSDITIDFIVSEHVDAIEKAFSTGNFGSVVEFEEPALKMCIFNNEVTLPPKTISLYPVLIKPLCETVGIKPDSLIRIQLIPQEGFKMTTMYEYPNN